MRFLSLSRVPKTRVECLLESKLITDKGQKELSSQNLPSSSGFSKTFGPNLTRLIGRLLHSSPQYGGSWRITAESVLRDARTWYQVWNISRTAICRDLLRSFDHYTHVLW